MRLRNSSKVALEKTKLPFFKICCAKAWGAPLLESAALSKTLVSSTQSVTGIQQFIKLFWGEASGLGQCSGLFQAVLQAVGIKEAHGFIVFGGHHDTDHSVMFQHLHWLALSGVQKMAEMGFGLVGGESLHVVSLDQIVRFVQIMRNSKNRALCRLSLRQTDLLTK
jgi:hypothetical protein